jgi:hypothetical protein
VGEAKRRRKEIEKLKGAEEKWLATLSPDESAAARISRQAYEHIVIRHQLTGGCYLLAFFLNQYLRKMHHIATNIVVGWINDGTWEGMASHAWLLLNGKKIDIALAMTEHPDAQIPGDLIILDRIVQQGKAHYSYHREESAESRAYVKSRVREGSFPSELIEQKDREHAMVKNAAASEEGIASFLNSAPANRNYEALSHMML